MQDVLHIVEKAGEAIALFLLVAYSITKALRLKQSRSMLSDAQSTV